MAFMGYPDAAFKVWRVEYALDASRKMRICKFKLCSRVSEKNISWTNQL